MDSILHDPNNHAPPVSPGDDWGDAEGIEAESCDSRAILPQRRTALDKSASTADASSQVGLRIDHTRVREASSEPAPRLEVLEHKSSVIRLDQPTEAPPKVVAQFKFHEKQQITNEGRRLQGEGRDWGDRHRFSLRWIVGLGLGIGGLVVLSISLLPLINASNASRAGSKERLLIVQEDAPRIDIPNLDFLVTKQVAALTIFCSYWRATEVAEILPLVRDSSKLGDVLVKNWQPKEIVGDRPRNFPPENSTWEVVELGGTAHAILRLELPDTGNQEAYFIRKGEELQMDWKATSAFGTATFDELSAGMGDATEVRGSISRAEFYSSLWPESDYQSYRFLSPHDERVVWVYARRGESAENSLISWIGSGEITGEKQPAQKITLHLERGPNDTLPNQWLIREVLQIDWLTP